MPKTKISEFSATPANNTDIDSINIAEGCAPSGINDAIRELMAQLKDFQTGAAGDSFNGPIGTSTAAAGAFTTLSASSTTTLSGLTASTALALDASKNVVSVTNTGTGSNVLATSPTLVTPALGTPSALVGTNITGTASGLTAGNVTTNANLTGAVTSVGNATSLGSFTSSQLATALTDETGSGANVFATSPTLVTPILGTPTSATLTNATGLPLTTGVTGTLPTANGGTGLTSFTSGGVVYASSSSALATGSALTFDGTNFGVTGVLDVDAADGAVGVRLRQNATIGAGTEYTVKVTENIGVTFDSTDGGTVARSFIWTQVGSEQMRLTSTGLGIGTSSPGVKLDVSGANGNFIRYTSTAGVSAIIGDGSGLHGQTGTTTNHPFVFITNATERMRLDSAGNLGLGLPPSAWYSLYRAQQIGYGGSIYGGNGLYATLISVGANHYVNSAGNNIYLQSEFASAYQQVSGTHKWLTAASGTAGNAISFTQAMTLDASGRLLVGLTSTNSAFGGKLQVEGTSDAFASLVRYSSSAGGAPALYLARSKSATLGTNTIVASGDTLGTLVFSGANGTGYSDAAYIQAFVDGTPGASADMPGRLVFATSADGSATPTERARIDSSGNLLVGLTSATGVAKLQVSGALRTTGFTVATLPTGTVGMRTYVTDALAPSFSATVVGGGAVTIPVFYNGTNWIVA